MTKVRMFGPTPTGSPDTRPGYPPGRCHFYNPQGYTPASTTANNHARGMSTLPLTPYLQSPHHEARRETHPGESKF